MVVIFSTVTQEYHFSVCDRSTCLACVVHYYILTRYRLLLNKIWPSVDRLRANCIILHAVRLNIQNVCFSLTSDVFGSFGFRDVVQQNLLSWGRYRLDFRACIRRYPIAVAAHLREHAEGRGHLAWVGWDPPSLGSGSDASKPAFANQVLFGSARRDLRYFPQNCNRAHLCFDVQK